ncbi:MAG: DNA translocase FtsK 4TM domain-containing protein, partial [Pseudomonadales bacterium]|nr:DNA translocase FtsK 4TM domain-containing protein [Pseudomonadales bacterium]
MSKANQNQPADGSANGKISEKGQEILQRVSHEGLLISLIALFVYLMLALLSYSSSDPGWSSTGMSGEAIHNLAGPTGAWLSDRLYSWFGNLAYLLPVILVYQALIQFRDRNKPFTLDWMLIALRFTGFILVMVSATGLASLQFYDAEQSLPFSSGGLLGEEIAAATEAAFNRIGATILLLAILFFGCTIFTDISWLAVMDFLGQLVLTAYDKAGDYVRNKRIEKEEKHIAEQAQKERKAAVEIKSQKQLEKKPPKITPPVITPPKPSVRAQKEKQGTLFETAVTGELPKLELLDKASENQDTGFSEESLEAMSKLLELKLQDFGISAEVVSVQPGPVITRFEIQPAPGVKASRISNLAKDLARSLSLVSVRVVEVIPGKSFVGIETPNEKRQMVLLREVLASEAYEKAKSPLTFALGHDISGQPVMADLAKMPHLLVAGTTGSGKSVGVNSMLISLLYKATPREVRLILVDPKMLELSIYEGIPHLLTPVITDMNDASNGLRWCVGEMERRYKLMAAMGVRNLAGFNRKIEEANARGEQIPDPLWVPDPMVLDVENQEAPNLDTLPFIVVVIDEFADMMMIVGKKVEQLIARIAQKARAAGIHMVLATQRPSVDVITGL